MRTGTVCRTRQIPLRTTISTTVLTTISGGTAATSSGTPTTTASSITSMPGRMILTTGCLPGVMLTATASRTSRIPIHGAAPMPALSMGLSGDLISSGTPTATVRPIIGTRLHLVMTGMGTGYATILILRPTTRPITVLTTIAHGMAMPWATMTSTGFRTSTTLIRMEARPMCPILASCLGLRLRR